ncbi:STAS domain-containing protein [Thermincola ferriacetica]
MIDVRIKQEGYTKHIALSGNIDMANASECEEILTNNLTGVTKMALDLSGLLFIDSTGVGSLVSAIKCAFDKNIQFELVNVPEGIDEVFEIIGLYEVLQQGPGK